MGHGEKVLLTGATGFLGRHLARELHGRGASVLGIATRAQENAPSEYLEAYRPLHLPAPELGEVVGVFQPDVLIHCAGRASVDLSVRDPAGDFESSVVVTQAVLEALRVHAPSCRMVYVSSAAVYGQPNSLPIAEEHEIAPISPYGFHRAACEQLCREYASVFDVKVAIARVFSAYGTGLRRQLLWDLCRRALSDSELVMRGTGEESRDFIHGHDVARALLHIVDGDIWNGAAFNVATGRETTVREVVELVIAALDLRPAVSFTGEVHAGNPANWRAEIGRMARTGFRTEIQLEEGIRAFANWCRAEVRGW